MKVKKKRKCKGMKKSVVKNKIKHEDYNRCLKSGEEKYMQMKVIRSRLHDVYSETVNKVALSANDDKRIIKEDGIHTFAIGHYLTKT